jgi:hypothetical protein
MTNTPNINQCSEFRKEGNQPHTGSGKIIDISETTAQEQGYIYFKNGDHLFRTKASSTEFVGEQITDKKTVAKAIDAKNGDIFFRSLNGDIVLQAKNIRIEGIDGEGGVVTIQSSSSVVIDSPNITAQGTNVTVSGSNQTNIVGTSLELITATKTTCVSGTDLDSSSVLVNILNLEKLKKFFSSICEG